MMNEDLTALTGIGRALWADPGHAERVSIETLTAVSLQHLTAERTLERVSSVLLARAQRDGLDVNAAAIHVPFYRLLPEERLILAGLRARWSYARLGRILDLSEDRIAEIAWAARLHLATMTPGPVLTAHPTGSRSEGTSCPGYEPHRPWTQRFVDGEMPAREKHFLQNHMMSCDSCRRALVQCKNLYYRVTALIPAADGEKALLDGARALGRALSYTEDFRSPADRDFRGSLRIFVRRPEVRIALGIALFCFLKIILRG